MTAGVAGPLTPFAARAGIAAELETLAASLQRVTARIHTRARRGAGGIGAGVVWSPRGLVVTNAHVVAAASARWPLVELADGRLFEARLVADDDEQDLAVLALEDSSQPIEAAVIGDGRTLRVGQLLVAVGHPLGVADSLSVGVVHAIRGAADRWVRADIRLAPGNSGGPLATLDGAVVGINSMVVRGLGIAISANAVADFVARAEGRGG